MATAISFDGLASGLKSSEIVAALMDVEKIPLNLLGNKIAINNQRITALQNLNTQVDFFGTLAKELAKPTNLDTFTTTSSSPAATVTTTSATSSSNLDFTVDKLAQGQSSVTSVMSSWTHGETFSIVDSKGVATSITAAGTSLDQIVNSINGAMAGVSASKIQVGDGQYRIAFTSTDTGAGTSFDITSPDGTSIIETTTKTAQDAEITMFPGTASSQKVTSASNSFVGILGGATINVTALSAEPVNVTVSRDTKAASDKVEAFVKAMNGLLATLATSTKAIPATASGDTTSVSVLTGNSTVRSLNNDIRNAFAFGVGGRSNAEIGIELKRDGTFSIDVDKFTAALTADPEGVSSFVSELATSVAATAKTYSDKTDGLLSSAAKSLTSLNDSNTIRSEQMTLRLESREASLKRTYTALEVAIQSMNSQRSSLSAAIGGLPKWNND